MTIITAKSNDERKLIINQIQTPDGTVLRSRFTHDFAMYYDSITKELYFTDGGTAYARRSINKVPWKDMSIWSDDDFEVVRLAAEWGTYGKTGLEPLQWIVIAYMTDEHIKNIIVTQHNISQVMKSLFIKELQYRHNAGFSLYEEVEDSWWQIFIKKIRKSFIKRYSWGV